MCCWKHLPLDLAGLATLLDSFPGPIFVDLDRFRGVNLWGPSLAAVQVEVDGDTEQDSGLDDALGVPLKIRFTESDRIVEEGVAEVLILRVEKNRRNRREHDRDISDACRQSQSRTLN